MESNGEEVQTAIKLQQEKSGKDTQIEMEPATQDYADNSTIGYISIKDFAYDESNPLHHGYFEEDLEQDVNNDNNDDDETHTDGDDLYKRQSVVLPNDYVVNQWAVAIYDFVPENENELDLKENDIVFISYKHGQGWLVAENEARTKTGLVPEEFVSYLQPEEEADMLHEDKARPFYLTHMITNNMEVPVEADSRTNAVKLKNDDDDDEWEDVEQLNTGVGKLNI